MRVSVQPFLAATILIALAYPACSQAPATPSKPGCNCTPQKRQPYTAEFKITSVQTLANGTTITRESTETVAEDSQGRHLHATNDSTPQLGRTAGLFANANDSVEGTQSSWDSRTHKARVTRLPALDQRHGCWANESGNMRMSWGDDPRTTPPARPAAAVASDQAAITPPQRPKPEIVDLGKTTIQGVEAEGHRFITTIPVGEIGNDQPLVTTREMWTSRQLGLGFALREINDDPRSGKRTRELVNLTQGEPDPAAFQPPDGYEVTTEELHQVSCTSMQ